MLIVAEIGSNWKLEEDIHTLIDESYQAGADWLKIQYLRADTLYSHTRAPKIHAKIKNYEIPANWISGIAEHVHKVDMKFCASVFDVEDIDFLVEWCDGLKLASGDLTNYDLMKRVAAACEEWDKVFMFSTGAGTQREVINALDLISDYYDYRPVMFNCVSSYPAIPIEYDLRSLDKFADRTILGVSDHTMTSDVAMVACGHDYQWAEKHFKGSMEHWDAPDYPHSLNCYNFTDYCAQLKIAELILGSKYKTYNESEKNERLWARRGNDGLRPVDEVHE